MVFVNASAMVNDDITESSARATDGSDDRDVNARLRDLESMFKQFMVSERKGSGSAENTETKEVQSSPILDEVPELDSALIKWQKQMRKDVQGLKVAIFNGDDWLTFKITVESQLTPIGLKQYLESDTPPVTSPSYGYWEVANALLRSYLLDRLADGVKRTVLTFPTAKGTWERLQELWGGGSLACKEDLQDEWFAFHQNAKDTMRDYIDNLNHLILRIQYSDPTQTPTDVNRRHLLLHGLDPKWANAKEIIKLSKMNYEEACQRLLEVGKRHQEDAKAFLGRGQPGGRYGGGQMGQQWECYLCGGFGHMARQCTSDLRPKRNSDGKYVRQCTTCHRDGHYARDCRSQGGARGRSPGGGNRPDKTTAVRHSAFAANSALSNGWLLDSGCTHHMTFSKSDFHVLSGHAGGGVMAAGGDALAIEGMGEVWVELDESSGSRKGPSRIVLKDVLFVPGLKQRLISISQL